MNKDDYCIDFPEQYYHSKLYPLWTNFIYGAIAFYSLIKAIKYMCVIDRKNTNPTHVLKCVLFFVFFIMSSVSCGFSIHYHSLSPSSNICNEYQFTDEEYKESLEQDETSSKILAIYSSIIIFVIFVTKGFQLWKNWKTPDKPIPFCMFPIESLSLQDAINILFAVCFIIGGMLCLQKGREYYRKARECVNEKPSDISIEECRKENLNVYNMYHSFWHILTGFAGFFWILLVDSL